MHGRGAVPAARRAGGSCGQEAAGRGFQLDSRSDGIALAGNDEARAATVATLLNYALYQAGWLAVVIGAAGGRPWTGSAAALVLLAVHLGLVRRRHEEWTLVVAAGTVGAVVDSLQVALGLLTFPSGTLVPWLCPPWVVVMWMQFATTFRFSLRWLLRQPRAAAAAGALGGPLAYWIGERLGAVELATPRALTLGVLGSLWIIVIPLLARLARPAQGGSYRLVASPVSPATGSG